jgi:methionyl-tRNA formyltransferase
MDDGPILLQSYEPIYSDVTGGELMDSLAITGGVTLAKTLKLINRNALPPEVKQDPCEATFAKKLKKTDGLIKWDDPVIFVERKIRAYMPWPGTYTFLPQRFRKKGSTGRVSILKAAIVKMIDPVWRDAAPGTVLKCIKTPLKDGPLAAALPPKATGPIVKCLDTALILLELKPEGSSKMDGGAFLAGRPLVEGEDSFLSE